MVNTYALLSEDSSEGAVEVVGSRFSFVRNKVAREVEKVWELDLLYGWHQELLRKTYVVRIVCKLDDQESYFLYQDFGNIKMTDEIVNSLRLFGPIKPSHIKHFNDVAEYILLERREIIIEVKDVTRYARSNKMGLNALQYYSLLFNYVAHNPDQFPYKSSNLYEKGVSDGVILDKHESFLDENNHSVAIKSGTMKKVLSLKNDQVYREVLEGLVQLGVLAADLTEFEQEINGKMRVQKQRLDKKMTVAKKVEEWVFVVTMDKSILIGGNQDERKITTSYPGRQITIDRQNRSDS